MPGKTRKPSIEEKLKQNIEFLDALLADLQATSPTVSASPTESRGRQASNGRESPDNPPPLPPPPSFEALDPHGSNPKDDILFPPPVPSSSLGQNLSELDSLLENLSNPIHYPSDPTAKRISAGSPRGSPTSPSPKPAINGRPASYKGPMMSPTHDNRPVDGHYRERNGPESPMAQVNTSHVFNPAPLRNQVQQTRDLDNRQSRTASTATKELDDLMASLSDFKVNVSTAPTPSQSRLSGDYAKPTKSKQQLPCMWDVNDFESSLGNKSCVTALDQTWHPEHFVCAACGRPFGESGFHERDGKPYCRDDYFALFAPRCGGCGQPIADSYISALSAHWHSECFVCSECHQAFPGGSFFEHEGRPYCEMHYHARRGTLCFSCQKPITGRCITAMHRKFHPEHFVCAFCLKQLNKGTFKEQNDKPYCHPCFVKLFG
ncbi:hypothetical protein pdam_00009639 [Pocillopora damicornis]|uniref:LIM zinc-binding domain-containing protein n=1 Tax=Pocillopora damicornis TaxID=46731 RepID=A0A3M6U014_POCDA|nr:hypothetical protein pdam_00009639 [Pocillopora damicornis]